MSATDTDSSPYQSDEGDVLCSFAKSYSSSSSDDPGETGDFENIDRFPPDMITPQERKTILDSLDCIDENDVNIYPAVLKSYLSQNHRGMEDRIQESLRDGIAFIFSPGMLFKILKTQPEPTTPRMVLCDVAAFFCSRPTMLLTFTREAEKSRATDYNSKISKSLIGFMKKAINGDVSIMHGVIATDHHQDKDAFESRLSELEDTARLTSFFPSLEMNKDKFKVIVKRFLDLIYINMVAAGSKEGDVIPIEEDRNMATLDEVSKEEYEDNKVAGERESTCLENELRLLLVGKTGAGKRATGNNIAASTVFESRTGASSITKVTKQHTFTRNGQNMQLIDVPGFSDTKLSSDQIKEEVMKCLLLSSPGLHAILFVIRIGRYTDEDKNTLDQFIRCFGKESMKFVIVILTGEDVLIAENVSLESYIQESPQDFQALLQLVNVRCIAVNNRGSEAEKERFFTELLKLVEKMVKDNGGSYYTNKMYQKVQKNLKAAQEKEKRVVEAKRKEEDERRYQEFSSSLREELKNKMEKEQLQKNIKQSEEKFKRKLEKEHEEEATKNIRRKISAGIGLAGMVSGGIIAFIGNEAFEFVGGAIGTALCGPVGAVVGGLIGGIIGQLVATYGVTKVGRVIAKKVVTTSNRK